MKIFKSVFLVLVISSLVLLAACTSESSAKTTSQTPTGSEKQQTTDNTASGSSTGIFANKPTEYKVAYNIISVNNGETNKMIQKITSKGSNKMKIELSGGDTPGSMIVYSIGNDNYLCSVSNGKESCTKAPGAGAPSGINAALDPIKNQLKTSTSTRTIAGVTAYCSKLGETEACASKEGVPLYLKMSNPSGDYTYEAFEYSTTVSDAELIPGEVTNTIDLQSPTGANSGSQDLQDTPTNSGE